MLSMKSNILFSKGNKKLPKSTYILNMGSATNCPSKALGLCPIGDSCYALKAEIQYPDCLPYRMKQELAFSINTAEDIATALLKASKQARKHKMKYFRFSEAGDFQSQTDVYKMTEVCRILSKSGVVCYGYTARKDLDMKQLMQFATVQGSGFMLSNKFKAVSNIRGIPEKFGICRGNCSKCTLCKVSNHKTIYVKLH